MSEVKTERGWRIESMIFYGFALFFVFLVFIGIASRTYIQRFAETSRWVSHTHEIITILNKDLSLVNHIESAQRGFLISGDTEFIEHRKQLMAELQRNLSLTLQQTADNPLQQRQLKGVQQALAERQRFYDHWVEEVQRVGIATLHASSQNYDFLNQDKLTYIRNLIGMALDEEQRLLNERNNLEQQHAKEVLTLFGILFISVLAIMPLIYWRVRRDMRLRRQQALEQKRLTDILDASPDLIATANLQGDYVYLNTGGRDLLGIRQDEDILTQSISHMRPQWSIDLIQTEAIPAAIKTGLWVGETAFISRTGREIPVSQVIVRHDDSKGSTSYISTVARDIRDFKKVEHDLTQAALYDQTHSAILRLFNGNYDRTLIFQGMLELLAKQHPFPVSAIYLYEEWSGTYRMDTAHAAPATIRQEFKYGEGLIGEAARENRTIVQRDFSTNSCLSIDSGLLSCQPEAIILCPVTYQDKRLAVIVLAASQTVTERDEVFVERLAAQLGVALHNIQQYSDMKLLADQLRLRSEEISNKNVELEHAGRIKSEFLATMSHELRTPMNAVIGFSEILRDGLAGPLSVQQKEYVNDIFESGQHLLSLINDVLDLSKIEAGRMQLDAEMTDIAMLLQNSLSIVKEKAASQHIKLKLEIAEDLSKAWVDPRKLKQIVYNLLSNAVKFTPPSGEVSLCAKVVKRSDVLTEAATEVQGVGKMCSALVGDGTHFLQISVTDSGIGIAAEDLQRLFQPFVQIDSKLSRRFEGTGLGLAMVRKLADLHGGAVAVSSKPETGSTFIVWLQYLAEPPVSAQPESAATNLTTLETHSPLIHQPLGSTPRVLILEDDDRAADLMRLHLETNGFNVTRATTAEAAMVMLKNDPPDLITLDILLPGMDGWEFLAQLKSHAQLAKIPVVIISVVADSQKGLALGAAQVLQKPLSAQELLTTISELGFVKPYAGSQCGKVLVVDDDPKAVNIIATYLEQAGYSVLRAYGGQEALNISREQAPELIVLDLMMPELSGFDIAHTLKQDERTAQIPIVVVTAKSITPDERRALKALVLAVLEKSQFDHVGFINEVQRALQKADKKITEKAIG